MENKMVLSNLPHTWIFDLDGTIVKHNGYKSGGDEWLPGALELLQSIPEDDYVLFLTARDSSIASGTEKFLRDSNVRYNKIIYGIPMGERIMFNDSKPSGLKMSYAVECKRDDGLEWFSFNFDDTL